MKPNIGLLNAFVRLTCGFTLLAWAISKMVRRPCRDSYQFIGFMAGMKIAEGITRFCPVTAFLEEFIKKVNQQETDKTIYNTQKDYS